MAISFPVVAWAQGTNIYEVNLRQFTSQGTFNAFKTHLNRLKDMGVDVLWFMPLTPVSEKNRKGSMGSYYACNSYYKICSNFGSDNDFKELIKMIHDLDMNVMVDWVANHTGCDHEWTIHRPDFYKKDEHGNFTECHGWSDVYDLDYTNQDLRKEMINAMIWWIKEFDIDGFRCDMAHLVPLDFWRQARSYCDEVKPLLWLAECEEIAYHEVFDTTYSWQWMHASENAAKQKTNWNEALKVLKDYMYYPSGSSKLLFTSNHDENSWNGTEYEKYGTRAKALAALSCCFPGVPLIYSGQENPNLKRLSFFEKDEIEWNAEHDLHGFYKTLLSYKKNNKALHADAAVAIVKTENEKVFCFITRKENNKAILIFNLGEDAASIKINDPMLNGSYKDIFSNGSFETKNEISFDLNEGEFRILIA